MKKTFIRISALLTATILLILCVGCGKSSRAADEIIEEMVVSYGNYGAEADKTAEALLAELTDVDAKKGEQWREIMSLWSSVNTETKVNENNLPDGLSTGDNLCIVALGFQLNPDGSMKAELTERLKVVLASAEKYPNAIVICTGGGTATEDETATEAGKMAEWLIAQGLPENRVVAEDQSLTTAQNAVYTLKILREKYPQVNELAIVSSDYHIATGTLFFEAECILTATDGADRIRVVSNAAYKAPSGTLSTMFQAGGLIELNGDVETAFEIYYDNYDIHELPKLK